MRQPQTGRYTGFKPFISISPYEEIINTAMMTPIKLAPVFSALSVVKIGLLPALDRFKLRNAAMRLSERKLTGSLGEKVTRTAAAPV